MGSPQINVSLTKVLLEKYFNCKVLSSVSTVGISLPESRSRLDKYLDLALYRYTLFYTAASVHSTTSNFLQITHTSLAHRKSFHVMPSERWIPAKVFMLGRTGTNEPQMGR